MLDPTTNAALDPVLDLFDRLGVPYYIGGSLASMAYGEPRTTMDADVVAVLAAGHVQQIVDALAARYYADACMIREAIERSSSFNLISLESAFKIDVYPAPDHSYARKALARRCLIAVREEPEVKRWFASPEDVVLTKLDWFRKGGRVSDRQWRDVLGVLKVQHGALDRPYMQLWADELGLADLLALAVREALGE